MTPSALLLALLWLPLAGAPRAPEGDITLKIDLTRREVRGDASAPVLMLEFSDFKCHACEKFSLTTMPGLEKDFIETHKIQMAFVDFPLVEDSAYTNVAESVRCAGKQGKYWPMHDLLWQKIGALADEHLLGYASEIGVDKAPFKACLEQDAARSAVMKDLNWAYSLGLSSRPTFFVGRRVKDTTWTGRFVVGAQSPVVFRSLIERMLPPAPAP